MWKGEILLCWAPWKELVAIPGLRLAPKHWTVTIYHRQKIYTVDDVSVHRNTQNKLYAFLCSQLRAFLCQSKPFIFFIFLP